MIMWVLVVVPIWLVVIWVVCVFYRLMAHTMPYVI
jgi:hypothetical protein